jgi:hypothetical protein
MVSLRGEYISPAGSVLQIKVQGEVELNSDVPAHVINTEMPVGR